jgi:hypothetical protein
LVLSTKIFLLLFPTSSSSHKLFPSLKKTIFDLQTSTFLHFYTSTHLPIIHIIPSYTSSSKMSKVKASKTDKKSKSDVKSLSAVKGASVTKPSQTPAAKSKQIAKDTATKVNGKKSSKPVVKEASPSSSEADSDSESEDDKSAASGPDSDSSDSETEVAKPVTNGKTNGHVAKKEVHDSSSDSSSSSDESESSDGDSDSGSEASDSDSASEQSAAAASDSEDSSSDSDSDEEAAPVKVAKDVTKKAVESTKAVVNGTAKAVAKATVSPFSQFNSPVANAHARRPPMTSPPSPTTLATMFPMPLVPILIPTRDLMPTTLPSRPKPHPRSARLRTNPPHPPRSPRPRSSMTMEARTCSLAT